MKKTCVLHGEGQGGEIEDAIVASSKRRGWEILIERILFFSDETVGDRSAKLPFKRKHKFKTIPKPHSTYGYCSNSGANLHPIQSETSNLPFRAVEPVHCAKSTWREEISASSFCLGLRFLIHTSSNRQSCKRSSQTLIEIHILSSGEVQHGAPSIPYRHSRGRKNLFVNRFVKPFR